MKWVIVSLFVFCLLITLLASIFEYLEHGFSLWMLVANGIFLLLIYITFDLYQKPSKKTMYGGLFIILLGASTIWEAYGLYINGISDEVFECNRKNCLLNYLMELTYQFIGPAGPIIMLFLLGSFLIYGGILVLNNYGKSREQPF